MGKGRSFRFGVLNERMGRPEEWARNARRAEELGYATFLLRDHFLEEPFGHQFAPLPALMAAACATTTLRVGTLVLDNDYRHPVMLAKEAATLDVLSGGRLELGIGAGWLGEEYERAGMAFDPASVRVGRLEEAVRVLKGLFADGPLAFTGQHYTIDGLENWPKPAQRPRPPILIGAGSPRMLRIAGREADIVGILNSSVSGGMLSDELAERSPEGVARKVEWVRQGAGDRFDAVELSLIARVVVTDSRRDAAEEFARERGWEGAHVDQVLDMPSVFIGTIDEIAADLQARREQLGFSYFVIPDRDMEAVAPLISRLRGA